MAAKKSPPDALASRMRAIVKATTPQTGQMPLSRLSTAKERRFGARKDCYKRAFLIMPSGERIEVALKNLSETGARIDFHSGASSIFGTVTLMEPSLGLNRRARIVWKDQRSAGLTFE